jgi:nitrate/nitrite transporter NarK
MLSNNNSSLVSNHERRREEVTISCIYLVSFGCFLGVSVYLGDQFDIDEGLCQEGIDQEDQEVHSHKW